MLATITVTDDDGTNGLTLSGTDKDYFTIDGTSLMASLNFTYNYESQSVFNVVITATDDEDSYVAYSESISLTLNDVDDSPQFDSSHIYAVNEDVTYSYTVLYSDQDGDSVALTAVSLPDWLTLTDNGDGTGLLGVPTDSAVGVVNVSLALETSLLDTSLTYEIEVNSVFNDYPEFDGSPSTYVYDSDTYSYTPVVNDVDFDDVH